MIPDICLSMMVEDSEDSSNSSGLGQPDTALGFRAQGPHGDSTVPSTADAETASDVQTQGVDAGVVGGDLPGKDSITPVITNIYQCLPWKKKHTILYRL